jgi:glucose/arabinose dehydrogenase
MVSVKLWVVLFGGLFLSACTLSIGWPSRHSDEPAPTSVPLAETASPASVPVPPEKPVRLPPGFAITEFARDLQEPRMMAISPDGDLYVAERGAGQVIRLPDRDGDGKADAVEVVASDLDAPSSLAFGPDGSLYVAESTRVWHLSQPDEDGVFAQLEVLIDGLPGGHHSTRTVLFSPDYAALYVSIGSSCNLCIEEDERRATIMRFDLDGSGGRVYARGLRNAVGITFRPGTDELWATNNGTDLMGDDLPPDTVYRIQEGADYGWPRCHAGRIADSQFGEGQVCEGISHPQAEITAHSAPLGLAFYDGDQFPAEYRGDLFVALHGSWNRSVPTGYMVVRIPIEGGEAGSVQEFATGWLEENGQSWGRPVDLVAGMDGSLLVSDDSGGKIYRIFYLGDS